MDLDQLIELLRKARGTLQGFASERPQKENLVDACQHLRQCLAIVVNHRARLEDDDKTFEFTKLERHSSRLETDDKTFEFTC